MPSSEQPPELPDHFPRGGAGKPQPLPPGASIALLLVSLGVLAMMAGMLAWLLL